MKILSVIVAIVLLATVGLMAETTRTLSDAEIQGRALAQQLCEMRPAENFTNTGILQIRDGKGNSTNYPIKNIVITEATNWFCQYDSTEKLKPGEPVFVYSLLVNHCGGQSNDYTLFLDCGLGSRLADNEIMWPFRHSDFWIADLGLEFFHWPAQKILKKEVRRSRGCAVLESTNPNPSTNGYSRVVSWIDEESDGIVQAQAYDAAGKLLKEFYPKDFKKVNGQWQVQSMQIENVQTGSRTRLEFDLKK